MIPLRSNSLILQATIGALLFMSGAPGLDNSAHAQGSWEVVARAGDPSPDGVGHLGTFLYHGSPQAPSHVSEYRAPVVNDRGEVAFWAGMSDTIGVYTEDEAFVAGTSDNLRVAARSGQVLSSGESLLFQFGFPQLSRSGDMWISLPVTGSPELYATDQALLHSTSTGLELAIDSPSPSPDGNGTIRGIYNPTANDHGVVVSHLGVLTSPTDGFSAIAVLDDGELEYVARTDVAVPGVGSFAYWGMPTINNSRQVAFYAHIVGGTGRGLYSVENGGIREIARIGQPAANGNGNWEFLGWPYDYQPALNNAGQIAFSGHAAGHSGVFVDEAGQITEIIGTGQPASDGNGTVGSTALWGFNDAGQAAVQVSFNGTSGPPRSNFGHVDDSGIYRVSHDEATIVARTSMPTPDGTGYIERFHDITMNDVGHVVYLAEVSRNPGEFSVDHGIFITDGIDTVQVARRGQQLENHFVSNLTFGLGASHGTFHGENLDPSRRPVNNYGQVAYQAQTFVSGGHSEVIALFTPQLHWRIAGNGDWDDNANWTLSITPFEMHAVIIDPTSEIVIAGPAGDGAARSVSLGPAGSESATLQLDGSSNLRVGKEMSVGPNGALRFAAGAQLAAETVANDGAITGVGRILADVVNRLGVIAPGNSVGTLEIQGDFVQMSDAILSMEIGDISDQLLIAGNALLGGTLAASFVSEFTPQLGDSFEILSAAGDVSGNFDHLELPPLDNDWIWRSIERDATVALVVAYDGLGDFNGDQLVDASDYTLWRDTIGQTGSGLLADADRNGKVDDADYGLWKLMFGSNYNLTAGNAVPAVPEPSTAFLVLIAGMALVGRRKVMF